MNAPETARQALLLDNQLCFGLYAASRRVIQLYGPLFARLGLTYTQYVTLLVLWDRPLLSVKELGDSLLLDSGTLTPMLKKMEKKGIITRTRSAVDERNVLIEITDKGRGMKDDALAFLPTLLGSTCLSPQELVELRGLIKILLGSLAAH